MGRDNVYKSQNRTGFLSAKERDVIDNLSRDTAVGRLDSDIDRTAREQKTVSSLMTDDIATAKALDHYLNSATADLDRLEKYHRQVREQPEGEYEWFSIILPHIESRISHLQQKLEYWSQGANRTDDVAKEVGETLSMIESDLNLSGKGYSLEEYSKAVNGESDASEELQEDIKERAVRRKALGDLLQNKRLLELFQYIRHTEPREQYKPNADFREVWDGQRKGTVIAGQLLMRDYGLVEHHEEYTSKRKHSYAVTERGELIAEVLETLESDGWASLSGNIEESVNRTTARLVYQYLGDRRFAPDK